MEEISLDSIFIEWTSGSSKKNFLFCVVRDFQIYFIYFLIYYISWFHPHGEFFFGIENFRRQQEGVERERARKNQIEIFLSNRQDESEPGGSDHSHRAHLCRSARRLSLTLYRSDIQPTLQKFKRYDNDRSWEFAEQWRREGSSNNVEKLQLATGIWMFISSTRNFSSWQNLMCLTRAMAVKLFQKFNTHHSLSCLGGKSFSIWIIKTLWNIYECCPHILNFSIEYNTESCRCVARKLTRVSKSSAVTRDKIYCHHYSF